MKKKGVNIIAILTIVLIVAIVGVVLLLVLKKSPKQEGEEIRNGVGREDWGKAVLELENVEQFRQFTESGSYECHIGSDNSGGSIYNVPLMGQNTVVTYYFNSQGKTTDFQAFYFLNSDITEQGEMTLKVLTEDELAHAVKETMDRFCLMFDCNSDVDWYLTNYDGTFTLVENNTHFQSIADGSAALIFSIRAKDGYFWELRISAEEKLISVNIQKIFSIEQSKDYVANISLYEGE